MSRIFPPDRPAEQHEDDRHDMLVAASRARLSRRSLLRYAGLAGAAVGAGSLLAACSSEPSTGGDGGGSSATQAPTTQTGGDGGTATTGTATEAPAATKGGTVTIAVDSEPPTMDPHASPSAITFYMLSSVGESLTYLNRERELVPWLAESWEISTDAKTFTFSLRSDVKFQDDTPFNAEAAKWNFDRITDPNYKAGSALGSLSGYAGSEAPDETTFVVNFEESFVPFITYSASAPLSFVSPTATEQQGDAVNQTPVQTGPYQVTEYIAKQYIELTRWDGYDRTLPWASEPGPGYLDKVIWKFVPESGTRTVTVQSGEVQVATAVPAQDLPRFQGTDEYSVVTVPWTGTPRFWFITVDRPPTDSLKVRQAINYAIDRDAIINTVAKGTGTKPIGPLTRVMIDDPSLEEYYPFDLEKARQLLEEDGYTPGPDGIMVKDGQRLEILLNAIDQGAGAGQLEQIIQGQLREIGIDLSLKVQARAPWYEDNYHGVTNGPVAFLRSGDWDGLYAIYHSSNIGGNFNWSRLNDPEIDEMLEQGRAEADPEKRRQLYLDLSKKLMDMAVCAPLVDELSVWVLRSEVSGLEFNGYTYPIITQMSLKQ